MSTVSRTVLKALGVFSGVQAMSMLCSVVRTKLIAVWIGPVGVALFAIYNSALEMLSAATKLNIRESAVRDISSAPSSRVPFVAGVVRWWTRRLGLAGAALIVLASPLLSIISFGDISRWWDFAALSVAMYALSAADGEQALLQGTGHLRRLATASVRAAVSGTLLSLPLYYFWGEASIVPSVIIFCVASYVAFRAGSDVEGARNTRRENIRAGLGFVRLGVYLTVSAIVTTASSYVFLAYVRHASGEAMTGVFQAGYTIVIRYTGIFFSALSMEFFPRVVRISTRPGLTSTVVSHEMLLIVYLLTPLVIAFMVVAAPLLELLYSREFMAALPFVLTGICAMIFRAVSYCMAYVMVARGDGRIYIVTEIVSSITGLSLNISMYHFYGMAGLGLSYVAWYAVYTLIVWIVYRRRYGMRLSRWAVGGTCVSLALTAAALWLRTISWWAVLPVLVPALAMGALGCRTLLRRGRH